MSVHGVGATTVTTGSTTPGVPETATATAAKVTVAGAATPMTMKSMAEARRRVAKIPRAEAKNLISLHTAHHLHHPAREAEAAADAGDRAPLKEGSGIQMTRTTPIRTLVQSASWTGSESS